ncbi:MAG: peptidoglycan recognition family protein [Phycisphaerales bacterium]
MTTRTRRTMRTKIVWSVLGIGMSLSVALLSLLDPGARAAHSGGMTLSPLMGIQNTVGLDAIFRTSTPIAESRWDSIVIVHSGTPAGSAADIAEQHRQLGYDGLGFHFVIGNGTRMGDGEIHVGYRWVEQRDGAELAGARSGFSSRNVIEVCLIGDGDRRPFTQEQLHRLAQVVTTLAKRLDIPTDKIHLHKDLAGTTSPGQFFPQAEFEQLLASMG